MQLYSEWEVIQTYNPKRVNRRGFEGVTGPLEWRLTAYRNNITNLIEADSKQDGKIIILEKL